MVKPYLGQEAMMHVCVGDIAEKNVIHVTVGNDFFMMDAARRRGD